MSAILRNMLFAMVCVILTGNFSAADDRQYKLYLADVLDIIDGDTMSVRVSLWPGLVAEYSVRVRGMDAPELRGASCAEEKAWAEESKAQLQKLYDVGSQIKLENVEYDAFSGRVLADVFRYRSDRWLDLKKEMVDRKMAVEWYPKQGDVPWCLLAPSRKQ
jgi:micrococcal nuclease